MAQHISAVGYLVGQNGRALPSDPDALRGLIGREPVALRDYLLASLDAFTRPGDDVSKAALVRQDSAVA
jgi:hypothetical protein